MALRMCDGGAEFGQELRADMADAGPGEQDRGSRALDVTKDEQGET